MVLMRRRYEVETFDFVVFRQDVFSITPKSMTFLVENGFDFNKLFLSGIHFSPLVCN